ncbi:hypothetical protein FOS14_03455 [Skermania sp. ID1734]|uniref:hypothetical protein n=1 Tax=Skermania sp. ID1734 TaxID=2597516 RepID=UPI0011811741|nr:hypothetical protein [Skermania sp. ID1734]TSE01602.1 hypothetical protein FOS14_03455 [Skermania sp. ID1734]
MTPPPGSPAALPSDGHRRPSTLDHTGLVVTHICEKGDTSMVYDFATLPVPTALQRSLATAFATQAAAGGPWRSVVTSQEVWRLLKIFTKFLAAQPHPTGDITDLSVATWNTWRISRPDTASGRRQITKIGALLRTHPDLPQQTHTATLKRIRSVDSTQAPYSGRELEAIRSAAAEMFEQAWWRVVDNNRHLRDWQAGRFSPDSTNARLGEALEHLARTGDVPLHPTFRRYGSRVLPDRYNRAVGGTDPESSWQRLFLTHVEIVSLAALMVISYGWNSTAIAELNVPDTTSDPGADGATIYRVELEKRRRRQPLRYETRNLTDWGTNSPGHLIGKAVQATAPARNLLAVHGTVSTRLMLWHVHSPLLVDDPTTMIRSGFDSESLRRWRIVTGLELNLRRLRRTVVVQHRRTPTQHSQDVHDSLYVLPDPATHDNAAPIITAGIDAAIEQARASVKATVTREEGDDGHDTATATCSDYHHSPFGAHGSPCRASFLLCLACPNAVVTPRHLPRLAYLHRAIDSLQDVLPAAVWDHDWREHHARLSALQEFSFTPTEWSDALGELDATDRTVIDALLRRELE